MSYSKKIIALASVVMIPAILFYCFEHLSSFSIENIRAFIVSLGPWAPAVFVVCMSLGVILLLPSSPFCILAGTLFGPVAGTVYSLCGVIIGSMGSYGIARRLGKRFVSRFDREDFGKIREYNERIKENGLATVFFLRLFPFVPFKVPNYILGLTKVRTRDYFWGTLVGMIPEVVLLALVGSSLAAFSWRYVLWISLAVLVFAGIYVAHRLKNAQKAS